MAILKRDTSQVVDTKFHGLLIAETSKNHEYQATKSICSGLSLALTFENAHVHVGEHREPGIVLKETLLVNLETRA